MTTKDELVDNIKAWMKVENELKLLQKEIKERRVMKKKTIGKFSYYYENE